MGYFDLGHLFDLDVRNELLLSGRVRITPLDMFDGEVDDRSTYLDSLVKARE